MTCSIDPREQQGTISTHLSLIAGDHVMSELIPGSLATAILGGEPVSVEDILSSHPNLDTCLTDARNTVLMLAARADRPELIKAFVANGASVDQKGGEYQSTPLHEAAMYGSLNAIRVLLELGAEIDSESSEGATPLILAAGCGECDAVKLLLEAGANVHHLDNRGFNAWERASGKSETEAMALLEEAAGPEWTKWWNE